MKNLDLNDSFYDEFSSIIYTSKVYNGWFEEKEVRKSISNICDWLSDDILTNWTSKYRWNNYPKKVAIVMAGNIPLVGFHDFN